MGICGTCDAPESGLDNIRYYWSLYLNGSRPIVSMELQHQIQPWQRAKQNAPPSLPPPDRQNVMIVRCDIGVQVQMSTSRSFKVTCRLPRRLPCLRWKMRKENSQSGVKVNTKFSTNYKWVISVSYDSKRVRTRKLLFDWFLQLLSLTAPHVRRTKRTS